MKSYYIVLTYLLLTTHLIYGQNYIQFDDLTFNNINPTWGHIPTDTTTTDNGLSYNDQDRTYLWDALTQPVEKGDYVYLVARVGNADTEGGLVQKVHKKTGELIWSQVYDRRTDDYSERPQNVYIDNATDELVVVNLRMTNSTDTNFPHFTLGTSVIYAMRKFDLETGVPTAHIFPEERNYLFSSRFPSNLYPAGDGENYIAVHYRSITGQGICYVVRKLGLDLNMIVAAPDTLCIELPVPQGEYVRGGLIQISTNRWVSLDAVFDNEGQYYLLSLFNHQFELEKTITLDLDTQLNFDFNSVLISYADEEKILLMATESALPERIFHGVWISHDGQVQEQYTYPTAEGGYHSYLNPFYDSNSDCIHYIGSQLTDQPYWYDIGTICPDINTVVRTTIDPDDFTLGVSRLKPLSNNDILVTTNIARDTIDEFTGAAQFLHKGGLHFVIPAEEVGLVSSVSLPQHSNSSLAIDIFPNPTTDHLYINDQPFDFNSIRQTAIYDMKGQLIYNQKGLVNDINVSNFSNGTYIVVLQTWTEISYRSVFKKM